MMYAWKSYSRAARSGGLLVLNLDMNANVGNWLQLYVDAVMERDPYKRLALVRKLKDMPKDHLSDEPVEDQTEQPRVTPARRSRPARRR
jgi:hypothetical protein